MSRTDFASRLLARAEERSLLCIGIDPDEKTLHHWNLPDTADGARSFALGLIEAVGERVALIKPQVAFFERFGPQGMAVVGEVLTEIRAAGALALADAKRLDIESTFRAYAKAWLGTEAAFPADALTVGAYMGADSLDIVLTHAVETGCGVFPVIRSSNPAGIALQNARLADGRTVAESLADAVTAFNARTAGEAIGPGGAVIGATLIDAAAVIDRLPQSLLLAPGIGAQGASIADLVPRFGREAARRALPAVSRAVAHTGPGRAALVEAVERLKDQTFRLRN